MPLYLAAALAVTALLLALWWTFSTGHLERLADRLVDGWHQAWRWFSVQAMALAVAVQAVWVTLPDDLRAAVPSGWVAGLTAFLLVAGIVGRLFKQPGGDA